MGKAKATLEAVGSIADALGGRLKRAADQGHSIARGEKWYHGTGKDLDQFQQDTYFTSSPDIAGDYAEQMAEIRGGNEVIYPVSLRGKFARVPEPYINDAGYDSAMTLPYRDSGYDGLISEAGDEVLLFDPKNAKSIYADFSDPTSSNLLAGIKAAAPLTAAAALGYSEDSEAIPGAVGAYANKRAEQKQTLAQTYAKTNPVNLMAAALLSRVDWSHLDDPARGVYGLVASVKSLFEGQGLSEALQQGGRIASQPVEQTAQQVGDAVFDATGSPAAATAALTATNVWGPM